MVENFRVALGGLGANKLRSVLTMLGITIGVAAVVLLISLGQAVQSYILNQFSSIGTNMVFVSGKIDQWGRPQPLTQADLRALSDVYNVPDAIYVAPTLDISRDFSSKVVYEGIETNARVVGVTPEYTQIVNRDLVDGRYLDAEDESSAARVAVIAPKVVDNLFGDLHGSPVGQSIRIEGVRFQIVGVLKRIGGLSDFAPGGGADNMILIPLTTAQLRLIGDRAAGGERPVTTILMQARDENSIDAVVDQIRETLREERGISFRDEEDFTIGTQDDLLASMGAVTGILTIFLGMIAGISLVVGGIGIMNIMLVTVTERTREIGLRKAVGAQRRDIIVQFLTEAIVLALIGGGIGMGLAMGATSLASAAIPDLSVQVQFSSVALAAAISMAIGVFFGIYPANRAASLNPIDALRYE